MDTQKQSALLSELIALAKADGKIDASELDFIHRIGKRMSLEKDQINHLFENPSDSVTLFTEGERISHFHKLLLVMYVDGEIHKDELSLLRNFGLKMGIRPAIIDRVLEKMNDYEDKIIPSENLMAIFKTYYN